jgi:hypothetical protein
MSRIIGLLLLLVLAVLLVPPIRHRATPYMQPALDPVYEYAARNRVKTLVNLVREEETLGRPLPLPKDFTRFVDQRDFQRDPGTDPWGQPYYLKVTRRAYYVGSPGRDKVVGTTDDIVSETVSRKADGRDRRRPR